MISQKKISIFFFKIFKVFLISLIFSCSSGQKISPIKSKSLQKYETRKKLKAEKRKKKHLQLKKKKELARKRKLKLAREKRREALKIAYSREKLKEECHRNFDNLISLLIDLKNTSNKKDLLPPYDNITEYSKKDCDQHLLAKEINQSVKYIKQRHTNRIGLLAPTLGHRSDIGKELELGAKAACKELNCDYSQKIITRNSNGNKEYIKKSIADLIFDFNVSIIVGGTNEIELRYLNKLGKALEIPILILNSKNAIQENKFFFKVSPSTSSMAKNILNELRAKKIKRIALLQPSGYSENLTSAIRKYAFDYEIDITQDMKYISTNFESMKYVTSNLLALSGVNRRAELSRLIETKKIESTRNGIPFNPETISLPPIQNFDAVIIPDNFKVIRHFLKLFKYYGVKRINLVGNHLWRSPDLITPWDPLLNDAIFMDFVGNYRDLPPSLGINIAGPGIFVNPDMMASIDFRLLGYRSILIGLQLDSFPDQRRFMLQKQMKTMYHSNKFFNNRRVFADNNQASWPTFSFSVNNKKVKLMREN